MNIDEAFEYINNIIQANLATSKIATNDDCVKEQSTEALTLIKKAVDFYVDVNYAPSVDEKDLIKQDDKECYDWFTYTEGFKS